MGSDYRHLGILERIVAQEEPRDMPEVYETYYKFASMYSRRALSFEMDRVAAFSAVVTGFKPLTQSENLLGLWLDDIWRGLIWRVSDRRNGAATSSSPSNPTNPPSPWPSWSWFSNPNAISWVDSITIWKRATPSSLVPQSTNTSILLSPPTLVTLPALTISAVLRTAEMEISTDSSDVFMLHQGKIWGSLDLDETFEIAQYR